MPRPRKRLSPEAFRRDIVAWALRIGVTPRGIYLQRMTRKWGSCSAGGRVVFAADLLAEPAEFRTAVVVHELLHLAIRNHGKLFKSLMSAYVPGWQAQLSHRERSLCAAGRQGYGTPTPARPAFG